MTGSFSPVCGGTISPTSLNLTPALLLPSMQCILQQNIVQRVCFAYPSLYWLAVRENKFLISIYYYWQEEILKLIKCLEQMTGISPLFVLMIYFLALFLLLYVWLTQARIQMHQSRSPMIFCRYIAEFDFFIAFAISC